MANPPDSLRNRTISGPILLLVGDLALRTASGLVVGSAVLRHLGPTAAGQLAAALALTTVLRAVSGFGFDAVLPQSIAIASPSEIRGLLNSAFSIRLLALLVVLPVQIGFVWKSQGDRSQTISFLLVSIGVFGGPLEVGWWYLLGRGQASGAVPWRIGTTALFALSRVFALLTERGVEVFAAIAGIELIVPELVLVVCARRNGLRVGRKRTYKKGPPVAGFTREFFRKSWPFSLGGLCFIFVQRFDLLVVHQLLGPFQAGRYSAVQRLAEGPFLLCSVVVVIAGPAIASKHSANASLHQASYVGLIRILALAAVGLGLLLSLLAPTLVRVVLGPKFHGVGGTFIIYLWSIVPVYLAAATSRLLIDIGKQNRILVNGVAAAFLSVVLSLPLVRWLGIQGAAWANTISYSVSMLVIPLIDPRQHAVARILARTVKRTQARNQSEFR